MIIELNKYYKNECYFCILKSILEYNEKTPQKSMFFARFFWNNYFIIVNGYILKKEMIF